MSTSATVTPARPPVRVISLPNGRAVTLSAYARAWRKVRELPPAANVSGWGHFPTPAGEIAAVMRAGLLDRINRHRPGYGIGRKWDDAWQWEAWRLSRSLREGVRVYPSQCPRELRARLAHRLTNREDV